MERSFKKKDVDALRLGAGETFRGEGVLAVTKALLQSGVSYVGGYRGFWHNGMITGVASNMFNKGDGLLIIMQNGRASATGQQYLPSSSANRSGTSTGISIEKTLRSLGVNWLRTVRTYCVAKMVATLKEAMRTAEQGLKVIIGDGECMLARHRRASDRASAHRRYPGAPGDRCRRQRANGGVARSRSRSLGEMPRRPAGPRHRRRVGRAGTKTRRCH